MSEGINSNSFQDLENLDGNQVHDLRSELERGLGSLEGERRDLRAERMDLVNRVRVLRNIVGEWKGPTQKEGTCSENFTRPENLQIHIGREGMRLTN